MTSRERVLAALRHEEPDRVPVTLAYGHPDGLCRRFGRPEFEGRFRQDIVTLGFKDPPSPEAVLRATCLPRLPSHARVDAWGRCRVPNERGDAYRLICPLENATDAAAIDLFPFPEISRPECHAHLDDEVAALQRNGLAVQGQMSQTIFELTWELCGMERTLMDLASDPDFILAVFDRLLDLRLFQARRYAQSGVDILRVGDDVGTQEGMMIAPALWRKHLKPRLANVIAAARTVNPTIAVNYHSDGNIQAIIPDLIEIGVTILNPIQPECMDPAAIKREYGARLTLLGAIGTQSTLPFGTPGDVKQMVARRMRECAPGGGFVIAPTQSLRPEVPWENIVAFYEAVEACGQRPSGVSEGGLTGGRNGSAASPKVPANH
jgi:uroporphyrinogen decarboxylase